MTAALATALIVFLAVAAALLVLAPAAATAQEFGGLDIGQPIANTQRLGLPLGSQYVGGYRAQKWARPNGVELSMSYPCWVRLPVLRTWLK